MSNTNRHDQAHHPGHGAARTRAGAVLEMKGRRWAIGKPAVEKTVGRLDRAQRVDADPVAQTATVPYHPATTSVAEFRRRIEDGGNGWDGQSVPEHVCDPMEETGVERPAGTGVPRSSWSPATSSDVVIETADVVLMCSDPVDIPAAPPIGCGTLSKMRQKPGVGRWLQHDRRPHRRGVFEPTVGFVRRPEIGALSISVSSWGVAVDALMLKRLRFPSATEDTGTNTDTTAITAPAAPVG